MKFVLDSCVALKWALAEIDSAQSLRIRDAVETGIHELFAPDVYPVEIAHALMRAERKGTIPRGDGVILLPDLLATPISLQSSLRLLTEAAEMSSQKQLGVYDCLYVVLADHLNCKLITADEKLARVAQASRIVRLSEF